MAIGLLARVDGEISAEHIERLLRDADGAPVAGSAHDARRGQSFDHAFDGRVHFARGDDLVANQPPFRAVAVDPSLVLDRLPGEPVAGGGMGPRVRRGMRIYAARGMMPSWRAGRVRTALRSASM